MSDSEKPIENLKSEIESSLKTHKKWGTWDAYLYNGGTGIVLLCTTLATFIPDLEASVSEWLPQVLTAFATFWVALDRALTFGPRWRFHITQRAAYRRILDRFSFYPTLPEDEKAQYMKETISQLEIVRAEESGIPGVGVGGGK